MLIMKGLRGKAIIAQSGGPTRVINASLVGAIREAARNKDRITELLGSWHGPEGIIKENFADLYSLGERQLTRISQTPGAALYSSRKKIGDQIPEDQVFEALKKNDIRFFFYIGGNDSADNARAVNEIARKNNYDLACFHIPKTIDNDLRVNDHTPGFGSAARYVANVFIGENYDNRSLKGVKLNVIMGRSAGFLTAASALARQYPDDGPHLIYVPEIAFDSKKFLGDLGEVMDRFETAVVAISEGIEDKDKRPLAWDGETKDSHGNPVLEPTYLVKTLTRAIKDAKITSRIRADIMGYTQRAYPETISEQDQKEAYAVGKKAVELALGDDNSGSVAILRNPGRKYGFRLELTSLESVAREPRRMPLEFLQDGNNVTPAFMRYVRPLIGSALPRCGRI